VLAQARRAPPGAVGIHRARVVAAHPGAAVRARPDDLRDEVADRVNPV